jgi:hypothetical protein
LEFPDRIFWGVITFLGISLLWLKFGEEFLPLWVGALIGVAVGVLLAVRILAPKEVDRG